MLLRNIYRRLMTTCRICTHIWTSTLKMPRKRLIRKFCYSTELTWLSDTLSLVLWVIFTGRIARKRQPAGIKFTHRPKIWFFAPLIAPIQVKLCRADGHLGPLGYAKFHLHRHRGWECSPKNVKNFYFLVKSHSLDRFLKFLGAFMRLTILH